MRGLWGIGKCSGNCLLSGGEHGYCIQWSFSISSHISQDNKKDCDIYEWKYSEIFLTLFDRNKMKYSWQCVMESLITNFFMPVTHVIYTCTLVTLVCIWVPDVRSINDVLVILFSRFLLSIAIFSTVSATEFISIVTEEICFITEKNDPTKVRCCEFICLKYFDSIIFKTSTHWNRNISRKISIHFLLPSH